MFVFFTPAYAQKVIVLSTGSNYLGQSKTTIQSQIESTIVAVKAKVPDSKIIMIIPFQNMSDYYRGSGTTTIPSEAAIAAATKYSVQTVSFSSSSDGIHPSDYNVIAQQIKNLTNVSPNKWSVVGDSIALALAKNVGASTGYSMNSKTPQYILDNFVPLLGVSGNTKVNFLLYGGSSNRNVAFGMGMGINHNILPNHVLRLSLGFEQKSSINPQILFVGLGYIYQF